MLEIRYASDRVLKKLKNFPKEEQVRIITSIESKLRNPLILQKGIKRLTVHNRYRLRVGNYRVIFERKKNVVTVFTIEDRKDVYKK